jgi:hypothetical protein
VTERKKVLFVGLWYHGYTSAIIEEMENAGYAVTYVDIQPRNFFFKVFSTLSRGLYQKYLDSHHRRAIEATASQRYDLVLFLQAHQISLENLALLRAGQKSARFVFYNWDALTNHNYLAQAPFFDDVYTFDRADADRHGFGYLPLFCVRSMQGLDRTRARPHSVYMIGNIVNIKRYEAVRKFAAYCREHGIEFKTYLVISPVVYFRMISQGLTPRGVHFRPIHGQKFVDMIESSLAVFDFANHQQSGYTMRTIENLCTGKKIITNNRYVEGDYFYSPDRILCFDGFNFNGVSDFLNVQLADPARTFDELHIQSFVRNLLTPRSALQTR